MLRSPIWDAHDSAPRPHCPPAPDLFPQSVKNSFPVEAFADHRQIEDPRLYAPALGHVPLSVTIDSLFARLHWHRAPKKLRVGNAQKQHRYTTEDGMIIIILEVSFSNRSPGQECPTSPRGGAKRILNTRKVRTRVSQHSATVRTWSCSSRVPAK